MSCAELCWRAAYHLRPIPAPKALHCWEGHDAHQTLKVLASTGVLPISDLTPITEGDIKRAIPTHNKLFPGLGL